MAAQFRSLLPHEPLPRGERNGFIHLQGAFTPKKRKSDDDNDGVEPDITFWTAESLAAALQNLLLEGSPPLNLPFTAKLQTLSLICEVSVFYYMCFDLGNEFIF